MTVLPELADDLERAADRLAARRRPAHRRATVIAGVVAGTVAAGGLAAAATNLWSPQIGDGSGPSQLSRDAPPADQLAALGVLRREQTEADRGAESAYTLRYFGGMGDIRVGYVRLLGTQAGGAGFVLVPTERIAASSRPTGLQEEFERRDGRPAPPRDRLCLFARDPVDGGGMSCFSLQQVRDGEAVLGIGEAPPKLTAEQRAEFRRRMAASPRGGSIALPDFMRPGRLTWFGIVPDGIVQVRAGDGPDAPVVPVRDNFFQVLTPEAGGSARLHYLDGDGHEIMTGPGH